MGFLDAINPVKQLSNAVGALGAATATVGALTSGGASRGRSSSGMPLSRSGADASRALANTNKKLAEAGKDIEALEKADKQTAAAIEAMRKEDKEQDQQLVKLQSAAAKAAADDASELREEQDAISVLAAHVDGAGPEEKAAIVAFFQRASADKRISANEIVEYIGLQAELARKRTGEVARDTARAHGRIGAIDKTLVVTTDAVSAANRGLAQLKKDVATFRAKFRLVEGATLMDQISIGQVKLPGSAQVWDLDAFLQNVIFMKSCEVVTLTPEGMLAKNDPKGMWKAQHGSTAYSVIDVVFVKPGDKFRVCEKDIVEAVSADFKTDVAPAYGKDGCSQELTVTSGSGRIYRRAELHLAPTLLGAGKVFGWRVLRANFPGVLTALAGAFSEKITSFVAPQSAGADWVDMK